MDSYKPIADYAVIGDTRSAALVSRDGSIDWLCWPRFDSASIFARLLDAERGGFFVVRPAVPFETSRRYVGPTNVLETTFRTERGVVKLLDLMPALSEEWKAKHILPLRHLLRRIECVEGEVEMLVAFAPRLDFGRKLPRLIDRYGVSCNDGPEMLHLRGSMPFTIEREQATARFVVRASERHYLALAYESHAPIVYANIGDAAEEEIAATLRFWEQWTGALTYEGPYRDAVLRSALTLKLLAYAPSGGIVAAPTTSLPEKTGGVRNWDYRFCWLRDAAFTASALYDCGFSTEGGAFVDWLLYATRLTQPRLQILYDVFGESRVPERELQHLEGYCASKPVRIGNRAADQFQLDVYGEVLGALDEYVQRGETLYRDTKRLACRLANMVVKRWREPDAGIWEKRSGRKQHVHAKVLAWSALECACRVAEKHDIGGDVALWRRVKDEIRDEVMARGIDKQKNTFVSIYDGDELDASLLAIARVGFLPPDDPRLHATIEAIRQTLGRDELLYRYELRTEDGLPPGEGAFLPCSFWLVEALAIGNRRDEAAEVFEKLLRRGNDLGLFSEEVDVESGALLGNFPQGLTHIGLMNAALRLEETQRSV